jgi:hypothetical protein
LILLAVIPAVACAFVVGWLASDHSPSTDLAGATETSD